MKRYKSTDSSNKIKEEAVQLPPRSHLHKTDKNIFTRFFYRTLAVIFIILTAGLLLWGYWGFLFPDE